MLVCWGDTRRSAFALSSSTGLPTVGAPLSPAQVSIRNANNNVITLGAGTTDTVPELALASSTLVQFDPANSAVSSDTDLVRNVVRAGVSSSCAGTSGGDAVRLVSSGWLRTTAPQDTSAPSLAEACGVSRAAIMSILPTTFAPGGIVRIRLSDAAARCAVSGPAHAASTSLTYVAEVQRWESGVYKNVATITHSNNATDLLAAVPLTTPLGGGNGTLGRYIEAWSSATAGTARRSAVPGKASVSLPGVVSLRTTPTRLKNGAPDPLSAVSLTVGSLACTAEDRR